MARWQTDNDICYMYRYAVNKKEQIKILAQLNACTENEIRKVLERNGIKPVKPHVVQHRSEPYKPWTLEEIVQLLYLSANGMKNKIIMKRTEKARAALEIYKRRNGGAM